MHHKLFSILAQPQTFERASGSHYWKESSCTGQLCSGLWFHSGVWSRKALRHLMLLGLVLAIAPLACRFYSVPAISCDWKSLIWYLSAFLSKIRRIYGKSLQRHIKLKLNILWNNVHDFIQKWQKTAKYINV